MARQRPNLEGLTERIVPAISLKFVSGNLTICAVPANVANNLTLTQSATDGKFTVTDGTQSAGPYNVRGNITIISSNAADTININLNRGAAGGFAIPGFLSINSRNGADTINITGDATNGGRISGNVILATGFANDTVTMSGGGDLLSIGGAISANFDSGLDTFNMGSTANSSSVITGKGVSLFRANSVNIANGTDPVTINGSVCIDNTLDYGLTNATNVGIISSITQARVAGNFVYNGGTQTDTINLFGTVQAAPGKNSVINMGQGTNTLNINAEIGAGSASDLIVTGGSGIDDVAFNDNTVISNDVIFSLGNGANLYGFNSTFAVNGDFILNAGNGDDNLGIFAGAIGGDLTLSLGNGVNAFTFASATNTTGAAQSASCHDFTYTGGDGDDTIIYDADSGAVENMLTVYLNSGSDVFDGTNSADDSYLLGYIALGLDVDPDNVIFRSALAGVTDIEEIFPNDTVTAV
jgi:hypothetical protein